MLALLLMASVAAASVGDTYVVTRTADSTSRGSDGSTSSAHDVDSLQARVAATRDGGEEIVYDLPASAPADARRSQWLLPARIFRPSSGAPQLMNEAELVARRDSWLRSAGLTQAACGHYIFTWNLFQITCDPADALRMVQAVELPSALVAGSQYRDDDAVAAAPVTRGRAGTLEVSALLDPARVRQAQAAAEAAMVDLYRGQLPPDMTPPDRSQDQISGTIRITFDTNAAGQVWRRTKVTTVVTDTHGTTETRTATEVIERRAVTSQTGAS